MNKITLGFFKTTSYSFLKGLMLLFVSLLMNTNVSWGQTPVPMTSQVGLTYTENFADIANWTNDFAAGTGASRWGSYPTTIGGTANDGKRTTKSSTTFATSTTGGVQKGTGNLVFLSTGSGTPSEAVAVDLLLDFTGVNAGTISFNWAAIDNASGTRPTSLRVFWSTDNINFTEITAAQVIDIQSVNSGSITAVALPVNFNNSSTARLRFYNHAGAITGSGSRDKISIDDVVVTALSAGNTAPIVSSSAATSITTTSAVLNGDVTSDGGDAVTERGFVYKTSAGVTISDNKTIVSGTTGAYTLTPTLNVNAQYYFKSYATNSIGTNLSSPELSFYTLANTPNAPTVNNATTSSLDVIIDVNGNPTATTFAIQEIGGNYVQANGTLGASAVWQTAATWGTKTVSGLSPSTSYTFNVKARNGASIETGLGGGTALSTLADETVGWCNVQWPLSQIITEGSTFNVYAQAYKSGLTEAPGQGIGLSAWIGYSSIDENPNSVSWTWIPATFNVQVGSNDEFVAVLGSGMTPGTYHYASRFQIGTGSYVYGGIQNNVWVSNTDSGLLTINALAVPTTFAATTATQTSFNANWNAVTDANDGYLLDVGTSANFGLASDLFFSEYIEGSSNNKYIEIYNGTGNSINLADYELKTYANGAAVVSTTQSLTGILDNGATIVYKNSGATAYLGAATNGAAINFNGDDAIALWKVSTNSFVDIFGTIGEDPGTAWTSGTFSTLDKTLVRNPSVTGGVTTNPSAGFPTLATEWTQSNVDVVSNLGSHTFPTPTFLAGYNAKPISGQATITTSVNTNLTENTTYYYRVRAKNGTTVSANSNTISVTTKPASTTWSASAWSNGTPDATIEAIIDGTYSTTTNGSFTAKKLTVNSTGSLTINSNTNLTVQNEVINNGGSLVVENNANLIQGALTTVNANTGTATVKRNSNSLLRLDYTMWSSPVTGQNLLAFSPNTTLERFYTFTPGATGSYTTVPDPSSTPFTSGTGYLIRMPNDASASIATKYAGEFTGTLNNGDVTIPVASGTYNAVGNPYPSTIIADAFLVDNTNAGGALYFWRKTNNLNQAGSPTSSYAIYTMAGGAGTGPGSGGITPNGLIQVGQGFIINSSVANSLIFKNTMRWANNDDQILKTRKVVNKDRIWLNMTTTSGAFSQALIAYMDGATLGVDNGIDGKYFNDSPVALTSNINGEEYTIQGRPAFDATDVVALNFKTDAAGDYTIAIDHVDGLFAVTQDIYLVDSKTSTETNLKSESYTFTAAAGVDNARFSLKYQKTLKLIAPAFNDDSVTVFSNNGTLFVKSGVSAIQNIKVFDIQGRLIAQQNNVKANTASISNLKATNQALIVQVTSEDNAIVNKKVVN